LLDGNPLVLLGHDLNKSRLHIYPSALDYTVKDRYFSSSLCFNNKCVGSN
jgi:hypothetical protein